MSMFEGHPMKFTLLLFASVNSFIALMPIWHPSYIALFANWVGSKIWFVGISICDHHSGVVTLAPPTETERKNEVQAVHLAVLCGQIVLEKVQKQKKKCSGTDSFKAQEKTGWYPFANMLKTVICRDS